MVVLVVEEALAGAGAVDGGGGVDDQTAAAVNKPIATTLLGIAVAEHTLVCRMCGGHCKIDQKKSFVGGAGWE